MNEWSLWVTRSFSKWLLNPSASPCFYYPDNDHSFWTTVSLPNYPHPSSPFSSQQAMWSFRNKSLIILPVSVLLEPNDDDDNKIIRLLDDMNSGYISRHLLLATWPVPTPCVVSAWPWKYCSPFLHWVTFFPLGLCTCCSLLVEASLPPLTNSSYPCQSVQLLFSFCVLAWMLLVWDPPRWS